MSQEEKKKVIAITSGGLDSTVLAFALEKEGYEVIPVNFKYGSRHNERERESAREIFGTRLVEIDIDLSFLKNSSLIANNDIEIPEGHYADDNMKSTVVPFRNGVMLSYATAIAEDQNAFAVAIGSHFGDHAVYPDCREDFSESMNKAMVAGTYNEVKLIYPFAKMMKHDIAKLGKELGIEDIMAKTWSCYNGTGIHCGKCGTCVERKEAFDLGGVEDQTSYVDNSKNYAI